jgi:16S rRNA (guanine966-N2)-methyltransferase
LRENATLLAPGRAHVVERDALAWLAGTATAYDIVFLDPPFQAGLMAEAMRLLEHGGWLARDAFIYIEIPAAGVVPTLPAGWSLHRRGRAAAVGYHLARRQGEEPGK